jgi:hypothetical protein
LRGDPKFSITHPLLRISLFNVRNGKKGKKNPSFLSLKIAEE